MATGLLVMALLGSAGVWADTTEPAHGPTLAQTRQAINTRYDAQEAACQQRFAVTDCLTQARAQRHAELAELRRQELALQDAQRRQQGDEKLKKLAQKQQAALQTQAPPATQASQAATRHTLPESAAQTQEQRAADAQARFKQRAQAQENKQRQHAADAQQASTAQAKYQRKQEEALQHRQALESRAKSHSGQPAAALPIP